MVQKKTKKAVRPRFVCKGCDIVFIPKSKKQKYHSEDCREDYYKRTYFAKTFVNKTCPNCERVFSTAMPKKQVYCEPECREDARRKRTEAKNASMVAERRTYLGERVATFERDKFKCTVCGRGPKDGAVLDVAEDGAKLVTVCIECKVGKGVTDDKP